MGHGRLRESNKVKHQDEGGPHDPAPSIPYASPTCQAAARAAGQATVPPAGARAAPARAGAGTASAVDPGTSPRRSGPACHHRRGGAVAVEDPAATLGQDLWDDVSPLRLGAAATISCAECAAGTRTCLAASWAPCPSGSGLSACSTWARSCWYSCGDISRTRARPPTVDGSGRG